MALNPQLSTQAANAAADAVTALLDGGYLEIYGGTQPTTADTPKGNVVNLATLVLNATAFGAAVDGVAVANAITSQARANATGTATWFRLFTAAGHTPGSGDEAGSRVMDGSVGTSGANLNLNSVAISAGATVSITAFSYTQQANG